MIYRHKGSVQRVLNAEIMKVQISKDERAGRYRQKYLQIEATEQPYRNLKT